MSGNKYYLMILAALLVLQGCSTPAEAVIHDVQWNFENGSPLSWSVGPRDGRLLIIPETDYETSGSGFDCGHWHFKLFADSGTDVTIQINLTSVWPHVSDKTHVFISEDGVDYSAKPTTLISDAHSHQSIEFTVHMTAPMLYICRADPYRGSDLEAFIERLPCLRLPYVEKSVIGQTVEGRDLEMIKIGYDDAPYRVVVRGRPHAWEVTGSWAIQGMIKKLTSGDADAERYLSRYCVYINPMANKDMIYNGHQYYNALGNDLNRAWHDSNNRPETYALEMYIESLIAAGKKPDLFVDWHNNTNEYFYYPSVSDPDLLAAVSRMLDMLHEYSWFTGPANTGANWATTGQMWLHYGIYSIAFEHNIDWIDGLDEPNGTPSAGKVPYGEDWELFGQQFCEVLYRYFDLSPQP